MKKNINQIKKVSRWLLLINCLLLFGSTSKANCWDAISIDNIIDNRPNTNTITVNFTFAPVINHSPLAILVAGLPAGYTLISITPSTFPGVNSGNTAGTIIIEVTSAPICDAFSFTIYTEGLIEYCVKDLTIPEKCTSPCPVFTLSQQVENCELCLAVTGIFPGSNPPIYADLSNTTIYWDISTEDEDIVDVYQVCVTAPNNTATISGDMHFNYEENGCFVNFSPDFSINIEESCACKECENSFAPQPSKKYVLSAWVKEGELPGIITYEDANITLSFKDKVNPQPTVLGPFLAAGDIIDGWQRIEQEFTVPATAVKIKVELNNTRTDNGDVFFDDIRIHPFNANMKSFVYDPVTLRLAAELDERNYATFYEYDEEGALIRVEKETARGVMTIQESRNATYKKP